ncbi:MAG: HEAT repeat domain-containing protein [Armatimonadetes bacterium]|nr:HEAT repeat domain-containing protein [Armatimonadota bacterium]MDW8028903.1 HEAT repeat domain-containing protein [Armatimonadota bacterium]
MKKNWALGLTVILILVLVAIFIWSPNHLPFFSPLERSINKALRARDPKERLSALMEFQNLVKGKLISTEKRNWAITKLFWIAENDSDERVRSVAINLLRLLGEKGTEMQKTLVKALERSPQESTIAVELLPQIATEPIWLELIDLYEHQKDPTVRDRLKRVLRQMPNSVWDEFCKRFARNPKIWQPIFEGLNPPTFSFRATLVKWALSGDPELRKGVLMLLAKFPPPPSESEKLKPLAKSKDFTLRFLVFSIWANSPSRSIIGELRKGLNAKPEIAYFASSALLKLGALSREEGRKLIVHPYAPLRAQGALALSSSKSIKDWQALMRALKDPDPEVVRNAAIALIAKGSSGLSIVLSAYENEKAPEKRAAILSAMAKMSHPKVFATLVRALKFGDWREKSIALSGISFHGDKALPSLEQLIRSQNKNERLAVIDALNAIRSQRALKILLKICLSDPDEQVRCDAALTLSNYGVKEAMPILADLVQKGSLSTATAAAMGLTRYGDEGRKLLREIIKSERRETRLAAARALVTFNDSLALEILRQQVNTEDLAQRISTLQFLARSGDEKAIRELIGLLSHDEPVIRLRARLSLYAVGKQAVPILIQALDSTNSKLKAEAALVLGALKATEAREKLAMLLKDEEHQVREAAQMALNRLESSN